MSLFDIKNKVNETDKNINEVITEKETSEQIITNTQNTENTIREERVQEKQIIKEGTATFDKPPTEDKEDAKNETLNNKETTETEQVDMKQEHSSTENNTEIVIGTVETPESVDALT